MLRFDCHVTRLPAVRDALALVADRAARLGVPAPAVTYGALAGDTVPVSVALATATGAGGARMVAVVRHLRGAEATANVVTVTDDTAPAGIVARYRDAGSVCDACQTTRVRHDTFVVLLATGALAQVGRDCLDTYALNPAATIATAGVAEAATGVALCDWSEGGGFGGGRGCMALASYLPRAVTAARLAGGFVGRGAARDAGRPDSATATAAWRIPSSDVTAADSATAAAILALASARLSVVTDTTDDYTANLAAVVSAGVAEEYRTDGLAASLLAWYARATAVASVALFGTVGARERAVAVRVTRTRPYFGAYGAGTVVVMQTDTPAGVAGLVWFASGTPAGFVVGATLTIDATVTRHGADRDGAPETTVNRANVAKPATPRAPRKRATPPAP